MFPVARMPTRLLTYLHPHLTTAVSRLFDVVGVQPYVFTAPATGFRSWQRDIGIMIDVLIYCVPLKDLTLSSRSQATSAREHPSPESVISHGSASSRYRSIARPQSPHDRPAAYCNKLANSPCCAPPPCRVTVTIFAHCASRQ